MLTGEGASLYAQTHQLMCLPGESASGRATDCDKLSSPNALDPNVCADSSVTDTVGVFVLLVRPDLHMALCLANAMSLCKMQCDTDGSRFQPSLSVSCCSSSSSGVAHAHPGRVGPAGIPKCAAACARGYSRDIGAACASGIECSVLSFNC